MRYHYSATKRVGFGLIGSAMLAVAIFAMFADTGVDLIARTLLSIVCCLVGTVSARVAVVGSVPAEWREASPDPLRQAERLELARSTKLSGAHAAQMIGLGALIAAGSAYAIVLTIRTTGYLFLATAYGLVVGLVLVAAGIQNLFRKESDD